MGETKTKTKENKILKQVTLLTNSWGAFHAIKLLANNEIKKYIKKCVFLNPVFNCWLVEETNKRILSLSHSLVYVCFVFLFANLRRFLKKNTKYYIKNKKRENMSVYAIYGSNDNQVNNDSNRNVYESLKVYFKNVNVLKIQGGTHGGWKDMEWLEHATAEIKNAMSAIKEVELPDSMDMYMYRQILGFHASNFLCIDSHLLNDSNGDIEFIFDPMFAHKYNANHANDNNHHK